MKHILNWKAEALNVKTPAVPKHHRRKSLVLFFYGCVILDWKNADFGDGSFEKPVLGADFYYSDVSVRSGVNFCYSPQFPPLRRQVVLLH